MPRRSTPAIAHSFEVWNEKGELAGGGYGVSIGGVFVTELQFSLEPNTSKIGFTVLNWHLAHWGFAFNDGKVMTPTCHDMGFRDIPRADFLARLAMRQNARRGRADAGRSKRTWRRWPIGSRKIRLLLSVFPDRTQQRHVCDQTADARMGRVRDAAAAGADGSGIAAGGTG